MKFKAGYVFIAATLFVFLALSGSAWAQTSTPPAGWGKMQRNPVAVLNRALESAGASDLSTTQQQQLTSLVNNYRLAHQTPAPDSDIQAAKKDLETAILAGSQQNVNAAAKELVDQIATRATSAVQDLGAFEIAVLGMLNADQVNALKTQYGNSGLLHTLGSLTGAWWLRGGFGGGRMWYGPGK